MWKCQSTQDEAYSIWTKTEPKACLKYIVQKLEKCGMKQSDLDPCLFIRGSAMAVMYVDDILIWYSN